MHSSSRKRASTSSGWIDSTRRLGQSILGQPLWREDPFWYRLVSDPKLLDLASKFIGDDISLMGSHYIAKPPRTGQPVLWHQDGSYWPLAGQCGW